MMSSYRMETTCIAHHVNQKKLLSYCELVQKSAFLTTMMAMRPPTSPTTVMGGFSLAIITIKTNINWCFTSFQEIVFYTESNQSHSIIKVDWVRWGKKCMNWPRTLCNGPTNPCNQMVKLEFKESCRDPIA